MNVHLFIRVFMRKKEQTLNWIKNSEWFEMIAISFNLNLFFNQSISSFGIIAFHYHSTDYQKPNKSKQIFKYSENQLLTVGKSTFVFGKQNPLFY